MLQMSRHIRARRESVYPTTDPEAKRFERTLEEADRAFRAMNQSSPK